MGGGIESGPGAGMGGSGCTGGGWSGPGPGVIVDILNEFINRFDINNKKIWQSIMTDLLKQ